MITPKFDCSQTETSVIVHIYVPAVRASDVEIHVDETLFSLHINPYFLRLSLPGAVLEDEKSSARYDPGTGYLTVTLTKANTGEDFKDLDIIARLLAPRVTESVHQQPIIEVLSSSENHDAEEESVEDDIAQATERLSLQETVVAEAIRSDWQLPQQMLEDPRVFDLSTKRHYGFLNAYTGYFRHVEHTENEINELGAGIETMLDMERRERRIQHENEKWNEDHYLADYADDDWIQELISFNFSPDSPFTETGEDSFSFNEEENMTMLRLPQKEYLTTPSQRHISYLTLCTILFSYAYDSRTTQEDPNTESAWTICSLTPAFSALDPPPYSRRDLSTQSWSADELKENLIPSVRRSLAFPLYRSFALSCKCIQDISTAFQRGKKAVMRALLSVKKILDRHEVYYIYSKIWIDDLVTWVAREANDETFANIGELLGQVSMDKRQIGWGLVELEEAVHREVSREPDSDDESEVVSSETDNEDDEKSISEISSSCSSISSNLG